MKLIVEPADGVAPIVAAIKGARTSVEIAIFRFDRKDIEAALRAAAARGVRVTALIAFANRGGEKSLRQLELRFLAAGIIVARTSDDLVRYHAKYILIDRRVLYVLSFNFTHLDIDHSRGFGVVTNGRTYLQAASKLFKADCTRTRYPSKLETLVVSPANSRRVLGTFLKRARTQLLIYDPMISDKEMLRILQERAKSGVEVQVIGKVSGRTSFETAKLAGMRLHTRTIIRDRRQAFVGSQSLRTAELDSRREVGLIIRDPKAVKKLSTPSNPTGRSPARRPRRRPTSPTRQSRTRPRPPTKEIAKAVEVFTKELQPLAATVKKAVRQAVEKAGDDVLHDKDVKDTMKQVVKQAVKEAVKDAVQRRAGSPCRRGETHERRRVHTDGEGVRADGPQPVAVAAPLVAGQGAAPTKATADDAAGFKEFSASVKAYLKLQKTVESGLPAMKPTDLPEMIAASSTGPGQKDFGRPGRTRSPATSSRPAPARRFATPAVPRSPALARPARARTCSRAGPIPSCAWRSTASTRTPSRTRRSRPRCWRRSRRCPSRSLTASWAGR